MAVTEQFHYSTLERGVGSSPTLVIIFFLLYPFFGGYLLESDLAQSCESKMCTSYISKARWPSGPRRATQEILVFSFPETWDVFASRKGRGFESHSCHFFVLFYCLLVFVYSCFLLD